MLSQKVQLPSRNVSLYVKQMGSGYPLVLMHGGLGADHSTLLPMAKCSDVFRLIFYDHRCNGRSTGASISTLTWDNLTGDAEALRERLGAPKWAVLGHSFGGFIAQEYTLRYPESVSHLILMDTGADACFVQKNSLRVLTERGFNPKQVEAARRLFNGEMRPEELPLTMLRLGNAYYHDPGVMMQVCALINALRIRSRPKACVTGFKDLLKDWTTLGRLKEIKVPVLLIAGQDDFQFPPEHQLQMARALPNARCEIIEMTGHNPLIENPKQTIDIIRDFMK